MKSAQPDSTILKDLLMPEIAYDMKVPLQEKLRALKWELVENPIEEMTKFIEKFFKRHLAKSQVKETLDKLLSLALRKWREQEIESYRMQFATLLQSIPVEHSEIMRRVMVRKLRGIGTKMKSNKDRKNHLAKQAKPCASEIASELLSFVDLNILEVLHARLMLSFRTSEMPGLDQRYVPEPSVCLCANP